MQGYKRCFRPRRGGVRAVALVEAARVAGAEYDPAPGPGGAGGAADSPGGTGRTRGPGCPAGSWRSIALQPGAAFVAVGLPEDQATFDQTARLVDGCLQVTQRLVLPFEGIAAPELAAVKELIAAGGTPSTGNLLASGGLVALVQTNDGTVLLLGCSRRLGLESPLRLAAANTATQAAFDRAPLQTVTLESVGDQLAEPYTGPLEGIF